MDIGSIMNIGALTASQPRASDSELSAVSRIENPARARAYSPGRKQALGRQDSDLGEVIEDTELEASSEEGPARSSGKINIFA
jgi:hypothetical protein